MARISKKQRLERTAYHEAGHAVICFGIRCDFSDITIVETEEFYGNFRHGRWYSVDRNEWYSQDIQGMIWDILVTLGGPAAENQFVGKTVRLNSTSDGDYADAWECLGLIYEGLGSNEVGATEAKKYIEYLEQVVKNYLRKNWNFVERLAQALLAEKQLTYKGAKELVSRNLELTDEDSKTTERPLAIQELRHL